MMITIYYKNNQLNKTKTLRKYASYYLKERLVGRKPSKLVITDTSLNAF